MKNLDKFVEELKNTLGDNLLSIIAFGSQANVEDTKSNLNLMIVTDQLTAENLYDISKPVKKWVKGKNPIPVIMNKDEWYSSFDVYAIEYADIKENYRIIYGEDLVPSICINKYFLRLQCESELKSLLLKYKKIKNVTIEDIIDFHYKFELIHPFGDGNGRVGRMIMFRECLRNNIMPFIVLDNDKPFYMRGLKNYKNDKLFLIDTIKHEQDLYEDIVNEMLDFYLNGK